MTATATDTHQTTTAAGRHAAAARFLATLAADGDADELLELRYRLEDGRMGQIFDRPGRVRALATRALALGRRTDVYVGCAPRTRRHGGRDAVDRAFALWADCDGLAAVRALERFDPAPAIASGTRENCHAYWPLTAPLERDGVERANRRLAHALGADPASADAARILRIPGTWSHKHQPATPVRALRLDVDRRLDAADVVGGLTGPPKPAPAAAAASVHQQRQQLGAVDRDDRDGVLALHAQGAEHVRCPVDVGGELTERAPHRRLPALRVRHHRGRRAVGPEPRGPGHELVPGGGKTAIGERHPLDLGEVGGHCSSLQGRGRGQAAVCVRSGRMAHAGRPACGAAIGKPVRRKRMGGGPPHWLIVPGAIDQLRGS
jgi:RepB DNA-primase from phage plasmid